MSISPINRYTIPDIEPSSEHMHSEERVLVKQRAEMMLDFAKNHIRLMMPENMTSREYILKTVKTISDEKDRAVNNGDLSDQLMARAMTAFICYSSHKRDPTEIIPGLFVGGVYHDNLEKSDFELLSPKGERFLLQGSPY